MATLPKPHPSRTWQDVARELTSETDQKRITELADELNDALEKSEQHVPQEFAA